MRKKIVAGNWKMNTLPKEGVELANGVAEGRKDVCDCVEIIVCPPFTHIAQVIEAVEGKNVKVGAQDCATEVKGAYTAEISIADLVDGDYSWEVEVAGAEKANIERYVSHRFYHPSGLDIDNNPENASFGALFVAEGYKVVPNGDWYKVIAE